MSRSFVARSSSPMEPRTALDAHFAALRAQEAQHMPDGSCLGQHRELNPRVRAILFDWLMEICSEFRFFRETYYLAISIFDRFLSRVRDPGVG